MATVERLIRNLLGVEEMVLLEIIILFEYVRQGNFFLHNKKFDRAKVINVLVSYRDFR